jgi:hypothetical protein
MKSAMFFTRYTINVHMQDILSHFSHMINTTPKQNTLYLLTYKDVWYVECNVE